MLKVNIWILPDEESRVSVQNAYKILADVRGISRTTKRECFAELLMDHDSFGLMVWSK